jgi:hypothetical protein
MGRKTRAGAAALTAASLLSAWAVTGNGRARPAGPDAAPAGLVVEDIFGRSINGHGLVLVDWEGYMANPAIKFYLVPPPDAALPARAVLTAREPRLYFDLPSQAGPKGPRKEVLLETRQKVPVHLSIFPDRDGGDEEHRLDVTFTDADGKKEKVRLPVRVIDQDRDRAEEFTITVDFSQDRTGFFKDEERRAVVVQAARDWAYFFSDMGLAPVPAGEETTLVWGPDGFRKKNRVVNAAGYKGYLLYVYGIKSRLLRSGGEPSPYGEFQRAGRKSLPVRRSGGVEVEVQGNYNTKGWLVGLADGEWWKATNLREVENDLYSVVHHEMGHALIFNPANRLVRRGEPVEDEEVRAYLGRSPGVSATDHLEGAVDPASLRGAFGNEFHGRVPLGRWLITRLDLLCAQALGYQLRRTSAFGPLALATRTLPRATTAAAYSAKLRAAGGIPFYHWEVVAGALPDGLSLDPFTGEISGTPGKPGVHEFTVRVRDYTEGTPGRTRRLRLEVRGEER